MKISVALCTYNGEKYIREQIQSIIDQTTKPDEIIICDDRSSDNTVFEIENVLKNIDISYKIEINSHNLGVTKNFEKAISLTSGDVIFLSDQDDIWKKEKISVIMKEFEKSNEYVMIFSDAELIDKSGKKIGTSLWENVHFSLKKTQELNRNEFLSVLLNHCVVTGATMAIKRDFFYKVIPFHISWFHDGWLSINAPIYGKIKAIKQALIKYRQHENNVVGASIRRTNLIDKIRNILALDVKEVELERIKILNRYKGFYILNLKKLNIEIIDEVSECVKFWEDMEKLRELNFLRSIFIILKNLINNRYKKYFIGWKGVIRDIVYLLKAKLIRRKNV